MTQLKKEFFSPLTSYFGECGKHHLSLHLPVSQASRIQGLAAPYFSFRPDNKAEGP